MYFLNSTENVKVFYPQLSKNTSFSDLQNDLQTAFKVYVCPFVGEDFLKWLASDDSDDSPKKQDVKDLIGRAVIQYYIYTSIVGDAHLKGTAGTAKNQKAEIEFLKLSKTEAAKKGDELIESILKTVFKNTTFFPLFSPEYGLPRMPKPAAFSYMGFLVSLEFFAEAEQTASQWTTDQTDTSLFNIAQYALQAGTAAAIQANKITITAKGLDAPTERPILQYNEIEMLKKREAAVIQTATTAANEISKKILLKKQPKKILILGDKKVFGLR